MSLKGNLETFYLNSILQLLSDDRKTGILMVKHAGTEVKVFVEEGDIIYATGSRKEDRLGYRLQNKGLITREQLQVCLEEGQEVKKALGKILVDRGFISSGDLEQVIRDQVEEIIFNMFLWEKGDFEYKDARLNLAGMVVTRLNVVKILLEASRRIDEMSILRKHIPHDDLIFKTSDQIQPQGEIKLNADEWQLLRLVDGLRSVRQIIEDGGFDEFSAYKRLYALLSSGLIENGTAKKKEDNNKTEQDYSVTITIYSDILQTIGRSLEAEIGKQMFTIFAECKPVLSAQLSELFNDYNPNNPTATNIHVISQALQPIEDYEEGRNFLIVGFNTFIANILDRVPAILGNKFAQKLLQEIEKLLKYVDTYQAHSTEKSLVINEVQKALTNTAEKMTAVGSGNLKSGGLFSKFKRA
jgi:hypothetical protein